jgi:hypothetical protein
VDPTAIGVLGGVFTTLVGLLGWGWKTTEANRKALAKKLDEVNAARLSDSRVELTKNREELKKSQEVNARLTVSIDANTDAVRELVTELRADGVTLRRETILKPSGRAKARSSD